MPAKAEKPSTGLPLLRGIGMKLNSGRWRWTLATGGICTLLLSGLVLITTGVQDLHAGSWFSWGRCHGSDGCGKGCVGGECPSANGVDELGGTWYWLHSPEEEKRITMGLYNRYCIRCHGVDGRGVWDIPGIPNFTDTVWQSSRSDAQIVRIIVEGRGAVMPQFRGTLSLEEAWAMARYLRTFVPGTEVSRPEPSQPAKPASPK
jgi:hypothetical protein